MHYFGGKFRIAGQLGEVINAMIKPGQTYHEPFCGAINVATKISGPRELLLSDFHPYLIAMWEGALFGVDFPDTVSEDDYRYVRLNKDINPGLTGFVGFGCSFAGKFFHGYARDVKGESGGRSFSLAAKRGIKKKLDLIKANGNSPAFIHGCYDKIEIPDNCLIYCDPPYASSQERYGGAGAFDHQEFNTYCKRMIQQGHTVLVSEYLENVPGDARILLSIPSKKSMRNKSGEQINTTEVLYTFN